MICYTSDSSEYVLNLNNQPFASGTQGKVYKLNEQKCIKIYDQDMPMIDREVFTFIKESSLPNVYKLYELLYKDAKLKEIFAYIMHYYQSDVLNILDEPTEYTIHNIDILTNTAHVLAENQILLKDRIPSNVVLTKDAVIMIDMDSCNKLVQCPKHILDINISNLLYLFKRLYQNALKQKGVDLDNNQSLSDYLDELFMFTRTPAKVLSRRMGGSKTPMDLFYWRY